MSGSCLSTSTVVSPSLTCSTLCLALQARPRPLLLRARVLDLPNPCPNLMSSGSALTRHRLLPHPSRVLQRKLIVHRLLSTSGRLLRRPPLSPALPQSTHLDVRGSLPHMAHHERVSSSLLRWPLACSQSISLQRSSMISITNLRRTSKSRTFLSPPRSVRMAPYF
jgi:hypothetical protein